MQKIARGEARTVTASVVLLTTVGRTFALRMGKRGQVERFEAVMTPTGVPEELSDGKFRVEILGTVSEEQSTLLAKGVADLTIFATDPIARLVTAQVTVEDEIGVGGALG